MQMEIRRLRQALFPSRDIVSTNILTVVVELYQAQIHGQISLEQTYHHQEINGRTIMIFIVMVHVIAPFKLLPLTCKKRRGRHI